MTIPDDPATTPPLGPPPREAAAVEGGDPSHQDCPGIEMDPRDHPTLHDLLREERDRLRPASEAPGFLPDGDIATVTRQLAARRLEVVRSSVLSRAPGNAVTVGQPGSTEDWMVLGGSDTEADSPRWAAAGWGDIEAETRCCAAEKPITALAEDSPARVQWRQAKARRDRLARG